MLHACTHGPAYAHAVLLHGCMHACLLHTLMLGLGLLFKVGRAASRECLSVLYSCDWVAGFEKAMSHLDCVLQHTRLQLHANVPHKTAAAAVVSAAPAAAAAAGTSAHTPDLTYSCMDLPNSSYWYVGNPRLRVLRRAASVWQYKHVCSVDLHHLLCKQNISTCQPQPSQFPIHSTHCLSPHPAHSPMLTWTPSPLKTLFAL